jgi:hypothetical protein
VTDEHKRFVREDIAALKAACRASHTSGPGGVVQCICGGMSGSAACNGLGVLQNFVRYYVPGEPAWEQIREELKQWL